MLLRRKPNKSGSISIQVIEKRGRYNKVIETIGCSADPFEIDQLWIKGKEYIAQRIGQQSLPLFKDDVSQWFASVVSSIQKIELIGPELILGEIFRQVDFDSIKTIQQITILHHESKTSKSILLKPSKTQLELFNLFKK